MSAWILILRIHIQACEPGGMPYTRPDSWLTSCTDRESIEWRLSTKAIDTNWMSACIMILCICIQAGNSGGMPYTRLQRGPDSCQASGQVWLGRVCTQHRDSGQFAGVLHAFAYCFVPCCFACMAFLCASADALHCCLTCMALGFCIALLFAYNIATVPSLQVMSMLLHRALSTIDHSASVSTMMKQCCRQTERQVVCYALHRALYTWFVCMTWHIVVWHWKVSPYSLWQSQM